MLHIEMLPAAQGMALWVEWDDGAATRRLLIDGGPASTYEALWRRVRAVPARERRLELLAVSHVDGDHIEGVIRLMQDRPALGLKIGDVWFNAWPQIEPLGVLGAEQGEMLGAVLTRDRLPWNRAFGGKAAVVPDTGPLPSLTLAGGLTVTLVGPFTDQLVKLRKEWTKVLTAAGEQPGDTANALVALSQRRDLAGLSQVGVLGGGKGPLTKDNSVANGSSLVVLLEHGGASALLAADAHADVLVRGLRLLLADRKRRRLDVDLFTLPHHGSRANISAELLDLVRAKQYLVSTNGDRYKHPDAPAVDLLLGHNGRGNTRLDLVFNYATATTLPWADTARQKADKYRAIYPSGIALEL